MDKKEPVMVIVKYETGPIREKTKDEMVADAADFNGVFGVDFGPCKQGGEPRVRTWVCPECGHNIPEIIDCGEGGVVRGIVCGKCGHEDKDL